MNSSVSLKNFAIAVTRKSPKTVFTSIFLFTLAGILEIFSLAAILPVLFKLIDPENGDNNNIEIMGYAVPNFPLLSALLIVLLLMSLRGLFIFLADYSVASMAKKIEASTKNNIFNALIELNWSRLLQIPKGNMANILLRETERYSGALLKLGELASSALIATILIASSIFVSWQAFLLFVLATLPYWFITHFLNRKIKKLAEKRISAANSLSTHIHESSFYIKYIKASALENIVQNNFYNTVHEYIKNSLKIIFYNRIIKHFPETFGILILGGLILFTYEFLEESPANIVFFLLLLFRGYKQLATLQSVLSTILEYIPSYKLCENFLKEMQQYKTNQSDQTLDIDLPNEINLVDVGFNYENTQLPALKGVNMTIPKKGFIACVGMSGSGKTTLGDIILGLLQPQSGKILINNNPLYYDNNLLRWRESIGYVPQDVYLISGTIRSNILFGARDQSNDNLYNAAKKAHLIDFVDTLDYGFETPIKDLGANLSGGQKQRIGLARALARNPSLLILDEATSALDNKTEKLIQNAIINIAKTKAVLVISHKLSILQDADLIYVMDKGKIVSSGSYDELKLSDPHFKTLLEADIN